MKKLLLLLATFVVVVLGVEAVYHWDYLATGRILPPQITLENCEEIKTEVWKYDWDRELALAVKQFQQRVGLPDTGTMDIETQILFGNVIQESRVLQDRQLEKALEVLKGTAK